MLLGTLLWAAVIAVSTDGPRLEREAAELGVAFDRYMTQDSLGRTITFYLSTPPGKRPSAKLPVVLFISGSGCQSLFSKQGERIAGGLQNLLWEEAKGRARVLAVEKPGVKYLDKPPRPGSAERASEEFLKEHTLPRWAEANIAALRAAWTLPEVDATRTLVVGHSEGGLVTARVAAELPEVTHVASLAGGGPTQLFDFVTSAARPRRDDQPGDAEGRVQGVYEQWAKIQKDPDSISRFWLGHPYRRWSSFLEHSVTEELLRTKARIYVAHGGAQDPVIPVAAHDMLVTELRARGREVRAERLEGANHSFRTPDMPKEGPPVGMQALLGRVLQWFLVEEGKAK
jgi:dipeptidyl aminopeptidase/acylaminoacyl peptidase